MKKIYLRLADGNECISYHDQCAFCEANNFNKTNAQYINDISIETTHFNICIEIICEYNYAYETADAIMLFTHDFSNMNEAAFVKYISEQFNRIAMESLETIHLKEFNFRMFEKK